MDIMNVFRGDAFSAISLTSWVNRTPFVPSGLGAMGLFDPLPLRTTAMSVEERDGVLKLIPTSPRGAPRTERTNEKRKVRYFDVPRIFHGDTIYSHELQNVREFVGDGGVAVSVLMQLLDETQRRFAGPTGILTNMNYTEEFHRLGAVQGILLDTDGSTLFNWFNEFGITPAAEVAFDLAAGITTPTGTIRPLCNNIVRSMMRAAQGSWLESSEVIGICGDQFYDGLTNHMDVKQTFLNWNGAQDLRNSAQFGAFGAFRFGDISWVNYRGSDNNTEIAIATDKVKFFPKGAPGVFQKGMAPGESMEDVNQPGKPRYARIIPDMKRNEFVDLEAKAYPLHICTRPDMLQSGRAGT